MAHRTLLRGDGYLYERVARELRRRVERGVYQPGNRIPSEAELVREFAVSPITIRRAVRDLTVHGLLSGRRGLGVFVTNSQRIVRCFSSSYQTSMTDDIRRCGYHPSLKAGALSTIAGPGEILDRLRLPAGSVLYRHGKVVLADENPVALDTTYLPRRLGDAIKQDIGSDFIFTVLARHGIGIDHLDYRFEAAILDDDEALALDVPAGHPVLAVFYTAFAVDGTAIMTGRIVSASDRFAYEFCGRPRVHKRAMGNVRASNRNGGDRAG